jgi:hypothetical protein
MARWDNPGVPHKGWTLICVEDLGEDVSGDEEIEYETCEMCHNERIRYVHILTHPEYPGEIRVGCDCACKMTEDYETSPGKERRLRNRAARKRNFMKQPWNINRNGNLVLRYKGEQITAIERNGRYGFVYQNRWTWRYRNRGIYDLETLKAAAFEIFDKE